MNFTYITTKPREGAFGNLQDDGSWNGMVGNLKNQEVDVGEPFEIFDNNILASVGYLVQFGRFEFWFLEVR